MTKKERKLTKKESEFCCAYVNTGNAREAAVAAGYTENSELTGQRLLCNTQILLEINSILSQRRTLLELKALSGYERLAFGNITDGIRLLYMQDIDTKQLESMDLFNISEIKKPKDGSLEIKFFDRIKALEKLCLSHEDKKETSVPFYVALEQSVKALDEKKDVAEE